MCPPIRRRQNGERRQLNQGFDFGFSVAARTTRQRQIVKLEAIRKSDNPPPATIRCLVFEAVPNPLHDVAESTSSRCVHEPVIRVEIIKVPAFPVSTGCTGDHAKARSVCEIEFVHPSDCRTFCFEGCPFRYVWCLAPVVTRRKDAQPGRIGGPGCVQNRRHGIESCEPVAPKMITTLGKVAPARTPLNRNRPFTNRTATCGRRPWRSRSHTAACHQRVSVRAATRATTTTPWRASMAALSMKARVRLYGGFMKQTPHQGTASASRRNRSGWSGP